MNLREPMFFRFINASKELKRRRISDATLVVGLAHSRGVNRVMPIEGTSAHSKGLAI